MDIDETVCRLCLWTDVSDVYWYGCPKCGADVMRLSEEWESPRGDDEEELCA